MGKTEKQLRFNMNTSYLRLTPKEFETWFCSNPDWTNDNWEDYWEQIGGELPKDEKKAKETK